jgi:hypothetical protein
MLVLVFHVSPARAQQPAAPPTDGTLPRRPARRFCWKRARPLRLMRPAGDPSHSAADPTWIVKNLFELKHARNVTIDSNVMEYTWGGQGQDGYAVLLTVYGTDTLEDIQFTNNIVRHAAYALQFKNSGPRAKRITVRNNLFEDIDGDRWFAPNLATGHFLNFNDGLDGLTVDHNTVFQTDNVVSVTGGDTTKQTTGFVFTNNLMAHNEYGVRGSGAGITSGYSTLQVYFPSYVFLRNLIAGANLNDYPGNNFYPAVLDDARFVDRLGGDYRLAAFSPYRNQGTDGKDIGCDILQLHAAVGIPNGASNLIMWWRDGARMAINILTSLT